MYKGAELRLQYSKSKKAIHTNPENKFCCDSLNPPMIHQWSWNLHIHLTKLLAAVGCYPPYVPVLKWGGIFVRGHAGFHSRLCGVEWSSGHSLICHFPSH